MKLMVPFVQLPLAFDGPRLAAEIDALGESVWRPHPQGYPGNSALTLITTGGDPESDAVGGQMLPTPHLERCPYLLQVLDTIGAVWGRTRLMRLSGHAEVTPHVDINYYWRDRVRVHVPIVTQPTVRFSCGDSEVNMAAGECWIFDTWRMHRVVNDAEHARIHLVADTVGGDRFWEMVQSGRAPPREKAGWSPRSVPFNPARKASLLYEKVNLPAVMSPWEMREHFGFLLGDAIPDPKLAWLEQVALGMTRRWRALWSCHGDAPEGWPHFRALLDEISALIESGAPQVRLNNGVSLFSAIKAIILLPALADRPSSVGAEQREIPMRGPEPTTAAASTAMLYDRPVFIVSPPRSGSTLLFETLSQAKDVYTIGGESHAVIEGLDALNPASRNFESNRLDASDATPGIAAAIRARFWRELRDRDGRRPAGGAVRMLEKTPKNSLRVPFLAAIFPDARFIYLQRSLEQTLASMIEAWRSQRFRTYPDLDEWPADQPWSLLLVPGWRALRGEPLERVVAAQWQETTRHLVDSLGTLPRDRWQTCRYEDLMADPATEIARLCTFLGLRWDRSLGTALPLSRYVVSRPDSEKWRKHEQAILSVRGLLEPELARIKALNAS
jgi:hypothetical protein